MKTPFSVTFDIATDESASFGKFEDSGHVLEAASLRECVEALLAAPGMREGKMMPFTFTLLVPEVF